MKNTRPGWRSRAYAAVLAAAACGSCTSHVDRKDSKDRKDGKDGKDRKDRPEIASAALAKCLLEDPQPHPGPLVITCPKHSCGQSAKIYSSFIEALDTHGEQVQDLLDEPFRLVRETLTDAGGGCRGLPGLSLEVRDGGFVGVTGGPAQAVVRCDGMDLVGARFQLEQRTTRPPNRKRFIVQIAARGSVDTVGDQDGSLPTYDLVSHAVAAPGLPASIGQHLCEPGRWAHPLESPTRHALLIQGETYRRDATVHHRGARWFNFGCAGSALAKMRLHGLDPLKSRPSGSTTASLPGASTTEMRQATLKMLTAKYCDANSWTKDGTPIYWLGEGEGSLLPRPVLARNRSVRTGREPVGWQRRTLHLAPATLVPGQRVRQVVRSRAGRPHPAHVWDPRLRRDGALPRTRLSGGRDGLANVHRRPRTTPPVARSAKRLEAPPIRDGTGLAIERAGLRFEISRA